MGFCTGTVCKSDKMQLTGKPENQKYWIYFFLLNTNPQHFGEMVASPQNASKDPVSTNGVNLALSTFVFFFMGAWVCLDIAHVGFGHT